MKAMVTTVGTAASVLAQNHDEASIIDATRIARRDERTLDNEMYEESEGILYAAGIAD